MAKKGCFSRKKENISIRNEKVPLLQLFSRKKNRSQPWMKNEIFTNSELHIRTDTTLDLSSELVKTFTFQFRVLDPHELPLLVYLKRSRILSYCNATKRLSEKLKSRYIMFLPIRSPEPTLPEYTRVAHFDILIDVCGRPALNSAKRIMNFAVRPHHPCVLMYEPSMMEFAAILNWIFSNSESDYFHQFRRLEQCPPVCQYMCTGSALPWIKDNVVYKCHNTVLNWPK
jgi:hypothetical protein